MLSGFATPAGLGVFAKNLLAKGRMVPLGKLLDGNTVEIKNYAQVALFIEWILASRKERLLPAIRAMAKRGSTALEPIAKAHLGASPFGKGMD